MDVRKNLTYLGEMTCAFCETWVIPVVERCKDQVSADLLYQSHYDVQSSLAHELNPEVTVYPPPAPAALIKINDQYFDPIHKSKDGTYMFSPYGPPLSSIYHQHCPYE